MKYAPQRLPAASGLSHTIFSKSCRSALQCSLAYGKTRPPGADCSHDEATIRIDPVPMPLNASLHQWLVLP
jgi:hypothetical protein